MKKIVLTTIILIPFLQMFGQTSIPDGTFFQIGDYSNSNTSKGILFTGYRDVAPNYFGASIEAVNKWTCCNNYPQGGYPGIKAIGFDFNIHNPNEIDNPSSKVTAMSINWTGNVGIGIRDPQNKLDVNGIIHAREVKVDLQGWSDFVFKKEYHLPTLEEVEKHILEKGHLANIPSEVEALENGINLGEMNAKLLQKIEELTLYVIDLKKEIQLLKGKNN